MISLHFKTKYQNTHIAQYNREGFLPGFLGGRCGYFNLVVLFGLVCLFVLFHCFFPQIGLYWSFWVTLLRFKGSATGLSPQGRTSLDTSLHRDQLLPTIPWVGTDVRTAFNKKIVSTKSCGAIINLKKKNKTGCISSYTEIPVRIWTDYLFTEILWVHHKSTARILVVVCSKCTRCLTDWSQELHFPWLQRKLKSLYLCVLIYSLVRQCFHIQSKNRLRLNSYMLLRVAKILIMYLV